MNGITFGKKLKELRSKAGIPSKELSKMIGKAVTYVSQLERGLIKKPDFDSCHKLLNLLGIEESKIEDVLGYYGIISPEREQAELEWASKQAEEAWNFDWIEQGKQRLKQLNEKLNHKFSLLIEKDFSAGEKLISHIHALTTSKDSFNFLCSLFEHDYSQITQEDKNELADTIRNFIKNKYKVDDYGDLIKKGKEE